MDDGGWSECIAGRGGMVGCRTRKRRSGLRVGGVLVPGTGWVRVVQAWQPNATEAATQATIPWRVERVAVHAEGRWWRRWLHHRLPDPDLNFVVAHAQPVSVAHSMRVGLPKRPGCRVQKGAVGRQIHKLPCAGGQFEPAMAARQRTVRVGQNPVALRAPPHGDFGAAGLKLLARDLFRTSEYGE